MDDAGEQTPRWTDSYQLGNDDGILNSVQNPIQHWLLSPGANPKDPNLRDEDPAIGVVFKFNCQNSLDTFKRVLALLEKAVGRRFPRVRRKIVFFPDLLPLRVGDEALALVGLARLSVTPFLRKLLLGAGAEEVSKLLVRDFRKILDEVLGDFFLTGLPIPEPDGNLVPRLSGDANGRFNVIMDTEIAFANVRFVKGGNTRIAGYWDQGAKSDPVNPLAIGRYLTGGDIDLMRAAHDQFGNVDEWALYAAYDARAYPDPSPGPFGPQAQRRLPAAVGHGTHVLDTFSGGGDADLPILAVELPQYAVDATHGHMLTVWVLLTLQWLATIKEDFPDFEPVLNYSFGGIAGRHDGHGLIEEFFDAAINFGVVAAITVPAGNTYQTESHAVLTGAQLANPRTLEWNIQPDDGTSSYLEIWLPDCGGGPSHALELEITPPIGPKLQLKDTDTGVHPLETPGGQLLALVFVFCMKPLLGGPARTLLAIAARHTAPGRNYSGFVAGLPELAGMWKLEMSSPDLGSEDRVEVWIERDDLLYRARTGARQSFFTGPRPVWPQDAPTDPVVRNPGTISDIATGRRTLVAAGHVATQRQPAEYSSEGFAFCGGSVPTASAVCEDSTAIPGVLGTGYFSGSTVPMGGTSTSSAKIARLATEMLADGSTPDRVQVETLAAAQDGRTIPANKRIDLRFDSYNGAPPRTRIGAGCLARVGSRNPDRFDPDAAP